MTMNASKPKTDFSDLKTRTLSAIVMIAIAGFALFHSNDSYSLLLILVVALVGWEVMSMHSKAVQMNLFFGAMMGATTLSLLQLPWAWFAGFAGFTAFIIIVGPLKDQWRVLALSASIVLIAAGLAAFHVANGAYASVWLIGTVAMTDIGGYFAGKIIGGPKVIPSISPKKTWSGIIGGWVFAALLAVICVSMGFGNLNLVWLSILVALSSQIGDIIESSVKRRAGVKDASGLIPGHGGLWDRFDGVLGAGVVIALFHFGGLFTALGLF